MNVQKFFRIARLFEVAWHFGRAVNRYTTVYPAWERYVLFGFLAFWGWSCTRAKSGDRSVENSPDPIEAPTTVYDVEGNPYETIRLGNQLWMAENLKSRRFRNGDTIPRTSTFYTWAVVKDPRGVCPEGWRIPSRADWKTLSDYAGGDLMAGKLLTHAREIAAAPNTFTLDDLLFGIQPKRGMLLAAPAQAPGMANEAVWWGQDGLLIGSEIEEISARQATWKNSSFACRCVYDQKLVQPFSWASAELWKHTRALYTNNILTPKVAYSKLVQAGERVGAVKQQRATTDYLWLLINLERFSFQHGAIVLNILNPHVQRVVVYQKKLYGFEEAVQGGVGVFSETTPWIFRSIPLQVELARGEPLLLVKIIPGKPTKMPVITLEETRTFYNWDYWKTILYWVFIASLVAALLLGGVFTLVLKKKVLGLFTLFLASIFLLQFQLIDVGVRDGTLRPLLQSAMGMLRLAAASFILYLLYFIAFLKIQRRQPAQYYLILGILTWALIYLIVLTILPESLATTWIPGNLFFYSLGPAGVLLYYTALQEVSRRSTRSYAVLMGLSGVLLAWILGVCFNLEGGQTLWLKDTAVVLGSISMIAFNGLGLIDHVLQLKTDNHWLHTENRILQKENSLLALKHIKPASTQRFDPPQTNRVEEELPEDDLNTDQYQDKTKFPFPIETVSHIWVEGNYIYYKFKDDTKYTLDRDRLKNAYARLVRYGFVQTHKSYLVNLAFVKHYTWKDISLSDGSKVPISRKYKDTFRDAHKAFLAENTQS